MIRCIGVLSRNSEEALDFPEKGTEVQFWRDNKQWKSAEDEHMNAILVSYSIQGLGLGSREKEREILLKLANTELVVELGHTIRNLEGAVVDAMYHLDTIDIYGMEHFLTNQLGGGKGEYFDKWYETPEGKKWIEWLRRRQKEKAREYFGD